MCKKPSHGLTHGVICGQIPALVQEPNFLIAFNNHSPGAIMTANRKSTLLVVDDEHGVRQSFNMVLKDDYFVLLAATGREAIEIIEKNYVDLVLLDILLPDVQGLDLLRQIKAIDPNVEVIMVTAVKEIQTAVQAIKLGANEYIMKPFVVDDIVTAVSRALEKRRLVREVTYLKQELKRYRSFEKMVGQDPQLLKVFDLIATIAQSDGAVLIQGESGTGKELVARAIHNRSPRRNHPFVVINCAAIPSTLMASELFGHVKGAYTGATHAAMGKLEIAHKGTIFLDDIDSLRINMQAKLLRVIQEKEFERLGSTKVIKIDVRFVAASNKDINKLILEEKFREDLYYRLNVFPLILPPLRDRQGDIPLLLDHFLALQSQKTGKSPKRFSEKTLKVLTDYDWPGNVRELQNLVERLFAITKAKTIDIEETSPLGISKRALPIVPLKEAVRKFEREYIGQVLENVNGSRKKASAKLGIHRNTLLMKTAKLNIPK
jgi:DNA-binding NtrC family response regulator